MATFGRGEKEGTVIGTQVKLSGILSDPNDIVVLGQLEGEVHSDHSVTIGPGAHVKGPIRAARLIIEGTVRGNVYLRDRLEVLPSGNINGNIEAGDVVIHSGATFNGRCQMVTGGKAKQGLEEETPATPTPTVADATSAEPTAGHEPAQEQKASELPRRRIWSGISIASFRHKDAEKKATDNDGPSKSSDHTKYEVE